MKLGYISDIGRRKEQNEDSLLCLQLDVESDSTPEISGLFIVADGMGGHKAGEIASQLAIKVMVRVCILRLIGPDDQSTHHDPDTQDVANVLSTAMDMANSIIHEASKKDSNLKDMGTTISAALIAGKELYVANAGDSRCYIINDRENICVTKDHSLVQEMADAGLITHEETRHHPKKNILTRVVGYDNKVQPDIFHRTLYEEDFILLCSDGLWSVVPDQQIRDTVLSATTVQQACNDLVELANSAGGPDNISVIIIKPENLPVRRDILAAETQALRISSISDKKPAKQRRGLFSFLR